MKKLLILLAAIFFFACSVEGQSTGSTGNDKPYVDSLVLQDTTSTLTSQRYISGPGGTIAKINPQYDTVPMILIVSDTRHYYDRIVWNTPDSFIRGDQMVYVGMTHSLPANPVMQIRGYEVLRDSTYQFQLYHDPNGPAVNGVRTAMGGFFTTETGHDYQHKQYLDADRKPLTLFVGMAFKIK